MPDGQEVQFQSPTTGAIQSIPPEHWDEALKQGYKPTTHVVMWSPDGQRGMVPKERMREKAQAGYQTAPETQFEKERRPENQRGFIGALADRAADFIKPENLKSMAMSTGRRLAFGGMDPIGDTERLLSVVSSDQNRQQVGRSLPYRAIAALGQSLGVSDPDAMEKRAETGDWGGVLGNAAVDLAPVAIAEGVGRGIPALRKPITSVGRTLAIDPVTERAAITPSTLAERWFRSPEETNRILDRRQLSDRRTQLALTGERDATKLNVPFSGDEAQGAQVWRDATRQNEPFAGEERSPLIDIWRDLTRSNIPFAGEQIPEESNIYRDLTRQNIPFAGEEIIPETQIYRDATRQNIPFAGESLAIKPDIWRDATKLNVPFAGEEELETTPLKIELSGSRSTLGSARTPPRGGNEGTAARWTNDKVIQEANAGNREGITQAIRRGLDTDPRINPNIKFIMGQPDLFRSTYNPREVTRFTPEGTPIRNLALPEKSGFSSSKIHITGEIPELAELGSYKPSEKVTTMSAQAKNYGPEFAAQQWQEEINRNENILRDPKATVEEKRIAKDRLRDAKESAKKITQ